MAKCSCCQKEMGLLEQNFSKYLPKSMREKYPNLCRDCSEKKDFTCCDCGKEFNLKKSRSWLGNRCPHCKNKKSQGRRDKMVGCAFFGCGIPFLVFVIISVICVQPGKVKEASVSNVFSVSAEMKEKMQFLVAVAKKIDPNLSVTEECNAQQFMFVLKGTEPRSKTRGVNGYETVTICVSNYKGPICLGVAVFHMTEKALGEDKFYRAYWDLFKGQEPKLKIDGTPDRDSSMVWATFDFTSFVFPSLGSKK